MEAVIKIGGSLALYPDDLRVLSNCLKHIAEKHRFLVVPGGGEFADVVRGIDRRFSLDSRTAHKMAILGMDQFGVMLSELIAGSVTISFLEDLEGCPDSNVPIILPSKIVLEDKSLEASWNVTSDSIAAKIASQVGAKKLILAKDVDGLFSADPKRNSKATLIPKIPVSTLALQKQESVVDPFLPHLLKGKGIDCYIVNGRFPQRIEQLINGKKTICTIISSESAAF